MRIKHRFFDNFSRKQVAELQQIGIKVEEGCDAFVLYADDPKFELVKQYFGDTWEEEYVSVTETDFTDKEKSNSPYLGIWARKRLGYPQPEDWYDDDEEEDNEDNAPHLYRNNAYLYNVFEIDKVSEMYGVLRGKQTGYLSISGEPKWGKSSVGALFWIEDILFTTPEVYQKVFEPLGIECRKVLGYGNQKPLKTIVQLIPQGVAKSKLLLQEEIVGEKANIQEWNLERYCLNGKGFYPSFENNPGDYDFFVSQELFGTGGMNLKENFISQKLYRRLKENNVKGLNYYPQDSEKNKILPKTPEQLLIEERIKRGKMLGGHILLDAY
jgi:hypothetical protein